MAGRVWENIISSLFAGFIIFISSVAFTYFFDKTSVITIGDSVKVEEKQFFNQVNISAYENINKLRISVPVQMTENEIKSNIPLNIKIIENNVGTTSGSVFEISKIMADSNVELVLISNNLINSRDIAVHSTEDTISVQYSQELINPLILRMKNLALSALLYTIMLFILTYISDKHRDKKIYAVKEQLKTTERELTGWINEKDDLKDEVRQSKKDIMKVKEDMRKSNILLQAKLNDYQKELSFWRDTIRKIIYRLPNGENKAEQLIKIVSSSLKTYQTHEKQGYDFEALKVLASMIKDIDKEEKS